MNLNRGKTSKIRYLNVRTNDETLILHLKGKNEWEGGELWRFMIFCVGCLTQEKHRRGFASSTGIWKTIYP